MTDIHIRFTTGNDGGMTTSADAGVTWTNTKNTGLSTQLVYTIDGSPFLGAGLGATIYYIGMQDNGSKQRRIQYPPSTAWDTTYFTGE